MNYQPGPHRSRAAAEVVATWIRQLWSQGTVAEAGKQGEITTASNKSFLGLVLAVFSLGNGLLVGWIIAGIARGQGANSVALVTSGGGVLLAVLAIVFAVMGIAEVNGILHAHVRPGNQRSGHWRGGGRGDSLGPAVVDVFLLTKSTGRCGLRLGCFPLRH
jgi:hypothetical protein